MLDWGANFGPMTMNGQWWRLVTCMFLHFGIIHLAMNMWILWGLAQVVERLVGSTGFAIAYMASGIAGSIASLAWYPVGVSAGASGAVFVTAAALLRFVRVSERLGYGTATRSKLLTISERLAHARYFVTEHREWINPRGMPITE